jgi:hypothetical protein
MAMKNKKEVISQAMGKYHEKTKLRAAIQLIPYAGGALDTLLAGYGSQIQEDRLNQFLKEISNRLETLESTTELEPSEELFDFLVKSFDSVIRTRSKIKRKYFADIFSKQVEKQNEWEEAEAALRFLSDLTDLHLLILEEAVTTSPCSEPFKGIRVITFNPTPFGSDKECPPKCLPEALSSYSPLALKMGCSELLSKGFLYDEGIGRWDTKAMEYLATTEQADWFMKWVKQ